MPPIFLSISLFGTLLEVLVHLAHPSSTSAYATRLAQLSCAPVIGLSRGAFSRAILHFGVCTVDDYSSRKKKTHTHKGLLQSTGSAFAGQLRKGFGCPARADWFLKFLFLGFNKRKKADSLWICNINNKKKSSFKKKENQF